MVLVKQAVILAGGRGTRLKTLTDNLPKPGMFFRAAREHHIDLTKTIFIGDDERDVEAGEVAGIKTILVTPRKNLLDIIKEIV